MPGTTPKFAFPYPLPTEPVAEGAQRIRELAERIELVLPTVEAWREVGAAGQPGFQNSWVNYGAPFETLAFYKDPLGVVHLKGCIKNGLGNNYCFGLPSGYFPAQQGTWKCHSQGDAGATITIQTSGVVYVFTTANTQVFLSGITFRAA